MNSTEKMLPLYRTLVGQHAQVGITLVWAWPHTRQLDKQGAFRACVSSKVRFITITCGERDKLCRVYTICFNPQTEEEEI